MGPKKNTPDPVEKSLSNPIPRIAFSSTPLSHFLPSVPTLSLNLFTLPTLRPHSLPQPIHTSYPPSPLSPSTYSHFLPFVPMLSLNLFHPPAPPLSTSSPLSFLTFTRTIGCTISSISCNRSGNRGNSRALLLRIDNPKPQQQDQHHRKDGQTQTEDH